MLQCRKQMQLILVKSLSPSLAAHVGTRTTVARYSHTDWEREQQAEPTRHAAMRYITISRPSALPPGFLSCYPSHQRPSLSDTRELASKGRLRTTDYDIVLLIRSPPPSPPDALNWVGRAACMLNNEPFCTYVLLLMRPWIMQACHWTASCHLGTTSTLHMLEWFYWWIGFNVCTRWYLHHWLKCQARTHD